MALLVVEDVHARVTSLHIVEDTIDGHSDLLGNTDDRFAVADATWRALLAQTYGSAFSADPASKEAQGEPGSLLREAYEARERAYLRWRTVRGLGRTAHDPPSAPTVDRLADHSSCGGKVGRT